jgi:hypothetical protein
LATALAVANILLHLRNYTQPLLQKHTVRICLVVPVYALSSWVMFAFPDTGLYVETCRDCYEAFVVYCFVALMLEYAGGDSVCVQQIGLLPPLKQPWPCCLLHPLDLTSVFLRRCKQAVLQFVIVKPLMVAAASARTDPASGGQGLAWWTIFAAVVYNVSYTLALYGLVLFYMATKSLLQKFRPVGKFVAVKLVIFLTFWQSVVLARVPGLTKEEAAKWTDFLVAAEMVAVACLFGATFGHREFDYETVARGGSVGANCAAVFCVGDVVQDVVHNFSKRYRKYTIQKKGRSHRAVRDPTTAFETLDTQDEEDMLGPTDPRRLENQTQDPVAPAHDCLKQPTAPSPALELVLPRAKRAIGSRTGIGAVTTEDWECDLGEGSGSDVIRTDNALIVREFFYSGGSERS